VEIKEEEVRNDKHIMVVETVVDGEKHEKQFNFTHDQTPGGELESWKKHIKKWIDKLNADTLRREVKEELGSMHNVS
jgi:hypothetical protein